jgi:hypothetical protein
VIILNYDDALTTKTGGAFLGKGKSNKPDLSNPNGGKISQVKTSQAKTSQAKTNK